MARSPVFHLAREKGAGQAGHSLSSCPAPRPSFPGLISPPGAPEIKGVPEMPEIVGDQDVPASRQPQNQKLCGFRVPLSTRMAKLGNFNNKSAFLRPRDRAEGKASSQARSQAGKPQSLPTLNE